MRNDFLFAVVLRDCLLFELKKKQVPYCINNRKILTVNNLSAEDYCSEPRQLPIVLRIKLFIQEVSLCSKSKMWRGARGREPGRTGGGRGQEGENRGRERAGRGRTGGGRGQEGGEQGAGSGISVREGSGSRNEEGDSLLFITGYYSVNYTYLEKF